MATHYRCHGKETSHAYKPICKIYYEYQILSSKLIKQSNLKIEK
jgi:hypothetical protein